MMKKIKDLITNNIHFLFAFFTIMIVFIIYACIKEENGLFIDEIYSYGLSNSEFGPFIKYIFTDKNMINQVIKKDDFFNYLTVGIGSQFKIQDVYFNQINDVHPPLFYLTMNFISSCFPGTFSKWFGLTINIICLAISLFFLYKIGKNIFKDKKISSLLILLYGCSTVCVENFLMIRMYGMLTTFTIILAYLISSLLEKSQIRTYIFIAITMCLGLLTQYYFVFYAFFVCLAFIVYGLIKKRYKDCLIFALSSFVGIGLFLGIFPQAINHLFNSDKVSGASVLDNILNIKQYPSRFFYFTKDTILKLIIPFSLAIISLILVIIFHKHISVKFKEDKNLKNAFILIVPSVFTFILVAIISPIITIRYIYNLMPIFCFAAIYLFYLSTLSEKMHIFFINKIRLFLSLVIVGASIAGSLFAFKPSYVSTIDKNYNQISEKYKNSPCIYFTNNYVSPISQDMLQVMKYDSVLVVNDPKSVAINSYLENFSSLKEYVVYIDTNEYWSSGYNPEDILPVLLKTTNFANYKSLYSVGLSNAYIIS